MKEGSPALAAGFGQPRTLRGKKLDAAYDFINGFLSGWAGAFLNRQGYHSAVLDHVQARRDVAIRRRIDIARHWIARHPAPE